MQQGHSADAEKRYKEQNRIIKECLSNKQMLRKLNETMAATIGEEIYTESLARTLIQPRLVGGDKPCPTFSENDNGPVVVVNLIEEQKKVLHCRAFRDSLREEEEIKTVRDIDFVVMRGQSVRPSSFPISNVCTLRLPDLNGHAYSMVERARKRMKVSLSTDETSLAIKAATWVASRFGAFWWRKDLASASRAIESAVKRIGDKNPVAVCSLRNWAKVRGEFGDCSVPKTRTQAMTICKLLKVENISCRIFHHSGIPDWMILVMPSGESLGQMPIFVGPEVVDYDKPERLIKGWLCYQDQGMVFVNVGLTNIVFVGIRGLYEMLKSAIWRLWRSWL